MIVSGDWLEHAGTQDLCRALESAGFRALLVGGAVRNALLGVAVCDIDVATDATPRTVTEIARKFGFRVVPTGIDHGTVTVVARDRPHEVTTFRKDVATDGRHAVVAFSTHIEDDAARRDFTMNAIYADRSGNVIDPLGGQPDLVAGHVRFVGDAQARIREDYLRSLRFFRFHAHFGDHAAGIDPEALAAIAGNILGLASLSRERVGAEMRKLLSAHDPAPAVAVMAASGLLGAVLAGAQIRGLAPLIHLEGDIPPRWQRRLAVLGGADLPAALRLSKTETNDLSHIRAEIGTVRTPAALGWLYGGMIATDIVLARAAVLEQPLADDWRMDVARGAAAVFPVAAGDLQPALQGPALGAALNMLKIRWLNSDLQLTREQLLV